MANDSLSLWHNVTRLMMRLLEDVMAHLVNGCCCIYCVYASAETLCAGLVEVVHILHFHCINHLVLQFCTKGAI
jgi:hypothetical protein